MRFVTTGLLALAALAVLRLPEPSGSVLCNTAISQIFAFSVLIGGPIMCRFIS